MGKQPAEVRDWAAERTNVPRAVCEAALSHTLRDKTEAAYHRTDLFERRRDLMETWSAFATGKTADIVAIKAESSPVVVDIQLRYTG